MLPAGVVSAALSVVGMARWVRVELVALWNLRARILAASMGDPPPRDMRVSIVGSSAWRVSMVLMASSMMWEGVCWAMEEMVAAWWMDKRVWRRWTSGVRVASVVPVMMMALDVDFGRVSRRCWETQSGP